MHHVVLGSQGDLEPPLTGIVLNVDCPNRPWDYTEVTRQDMWIWLKIKGRRHGDLEVSRRGRWEKLTVLMNSVILDSYSEHFEKCSDNKQSRPSPRIIRIWEVFNKTSNELDQNLWYSKEWLRKRWFLIKMTTSCIILPDLYSTSSSVEFS